MYLSIHMLFCLELMQNNMMQVHFVSLSAKLNCIIISSSQARNLCLDCYLSSSDVWQLAKSPSLDHMSEPGDLHSCHEVLGSPGFVTLGCVLMYKDLWLHVAQRGFYPHFLTWGVTGWMLLIDQENQCAPPKRAALPDSSPSKSFHKN